MEEIKVLTFADKPLSDENMLVKTCKSNNLLLDTVCPDSRWIVNAQKIQLLSDYIHKQPNDAIILAVDAFDVYINADAETIISIFKRLNQDIIFGAEANYYLRDPQLRSYYFKKYPASPTIYKYLNSGTFIGYAKSIKMLVNDIILSNQLDLNDINTFIKVRSDQYLFSKLFVDHTLSGTHNYKLSLDYNHEIFEVTGGRMRALGLPAFSSKHDYNTFKVERFILKKLRLNKFQDMLIDLKYDSTKKQFQNQVTGTNPVIIHIPGSWQYFVRVTNQLLNNKSDFTLIRILISPLAILAYLIALFIPKRLDI